MVYVVCPRCQNRSVTQDPENPRNFACSECGEKFILLPEKPESKDLSAVWDYLIQAGKHLKELEQIAKKAVN